MTLHFSTFLTLGKTMLAQGHRGETLPKTEVISDISLLHITVKR